MPTLAQKHGYSYLEVPDDPVISNIDIRYLNGQAFSILIRL